MSERLREIKKLWLGEVKWSVPQESAEKDIAWLVAEVERLTAALSKASTSHMPADTLDPPTGRLPRPGQVGYLRSRAEGLQP